MAQVPPGGLRSEGVWMGDLETPSPDFHPLESPSGALWKGNVGFGCAKGGKGLEGRDYLGAAVESRPDPVPQEGRAQGHGVYRPWPCLSPYQGALLAKPCRC